MQHRASFAKSSRIAVEGGKASWPRGSRSSADSGHRWRASSREWKCSGNSHRRKSSCEFLRGWRVACSKYCLFARVERSVAPSPCLRPQTTLMAADDSSGACGSLGRYCVFGCCAGYCAGWSAAGCCARCLMLCSMLGAVLGAVLSTGCYPYAAGRRVLGTYCAPRTGQWAPCLIVALSADARRRQLPTTRGAITTTRGWRISLPHGNEH